MFGGYKVQGRDELAAKQLLQDAQNLELAGIQLLVLECVPTELARQITEALSIPVIGIGAGNCTDGQITVMHDAFGITGGHTPKFAKNFRRRAAISARRCSTTFRKWSKASTRRLNTLLTKRWFRESPNDYYRNPADAASAESAAGAEGKRIALVPTMGNLHDGHMTLVDEARARADVVVVSIFVNPMQFDRPDDLARYPRTLQEDSEKLTRRGVDLVFAPAPAAVYPQGLEQQTYVDVPGISSIPEGASRPGHFRGVSTIVSKLFNPVQPDLACFGEKDYQQLALIRKMVADMGYDIDIVGVPTVRAKDGTALSSRNGYLTAEERKIAPQLSKIMNTLAQRLANGERHVEALLEQTAEQLRAAGFTPDELFIRDADSLQPLTVDSQRAVVLMAARLGKARLIDNQQVDLTL